MANIAKELNDIKTARYGSEVRDSIHDGIDRINREVEGNTSNVNSAISTINTKVGEVNQLAGDVATELAKIPTAISNMQSATSQAVADCNQAEADAIKAKADADKATQDAIKATQDAINATQGINNIDDTTVSSGKAYSSQKIVDTFVAKEQGKGLSSNDYDNTAKDKVDKLSEVDGVLQYNGNPIGAKDANVVNSTLWSELAKPINAGTYVVHNNAMWKCLVNNSVEPTDADTANWQKMGLVDVVNTLNSELAKYKDKSMLSNWKTYEFGMSNTASNFKITGISGRSRIILGFVLATGQSDVAQPFLLSLLDGGRLTCNSSVFVSGGTVDSFSLNETGGGWGSYLFIMRPEVVVSPA